MLLERMRGGLYGFAVGDLLEWPAEDVYKRQGGYRGETAGPLWPVDDKGGRDHDKEPDWRPLRCV